MLTTFLASLFFIACATASEFTTDFSANIIAGAEFINIANPHYKLIDKSGQLDLRPNLIVAYADLAKLTLRPRLEASFGEHLRRDFWMNEGFITLKPTEKISADVGRQNYLWGPAELTSPSNPLYQEILNRPNPLYLIRGVNIARFNFDWGSQYSLVGMAELNSMNDADFEMRSPEKETNLHRFLLKADATSDDGASNIGITLGQNKCRNILGTINAPCAFVGTYMMWTINSAFQPYTDLRLDNSHGTLYPFGVAGLRYTFPGGTEWRNEYIYKKLGLNSEDKKNFNLAINVPAVENQLLFQEYYYSSLRFHLENNKILGFRSLYALTNRSGILSTFLEAGMSERVTLTTYLSQTYGPANTDYNLLFQTMMGIFCNYSL